MKIIDLIKLSTRMFKVRTSRTLLTVFGMGVGISAILFLVSLGFGIQKTLLETITTADSLVAVDVFSGKDDLKVDQAFRDQVSQLPEVAHISPVISLEAQVKLEDKVSGASSIITDATFLRLDGKEIIKGSELEDGQAQGVVVTTAFAKLFSKSEDEIIGQDIKVSLNLPDKSTKQSRYQELERPYKIIGLIESEDNTIYLNQTGVSEISGITNYSKLKVKCNSTNDLNRLKQTFAEQGYSTSSLSDIVDQANKVFEIIRYILAFFGVIALFVSAIGMFNTMTVTLLERTEEIGIMKSIGASDSNIKNMFIFESTIMGFLGGASGLLIGLINSKLFNLAINFIAVYLGGNKMNLFDYPGWFLLTILISGMVVGFLTGIVPARRASRINPLDALRYK